MKTTHILFWGTIIFSSLQSMQSLRHSRSIIAKSGVELCGICRCPGVQVSWPSLAGRGAHARCFDRLARPECDVAFALDVCNLVRNPKLNRQITHIKLAARLNRFVGQEDFSSISKYLDAKGLVGLAEIYDGEVADLESDSKAVNALSYSALRRLHELREMLKDIAHLQVVVAANKPYDFRMIHSPIMIRFLSWTREHGYANMQEYVRQHGIEAFADFYAKQLDSIVNEPSA